MTSSASAGSRHVGHLTLRGRRGGGGRARDERVRARDAQAVPARKNRQLRRARGPVHVLLAHGALERLRLAKRGALLSSRRAFFSAAFRGFPPLGVPILQIFLRLLLLLRAPVGLVLRPQALEEPDLARRLPQVRLVRRAVELVPPGEVLELPVVHDGRAEMFGHRVGNAPERHLVRGANPDPRRRHRELVARLELEALAPQKRGRAPELAADPLHRLEVRRRLRF